MITKEINDLFTSLVRAKLFLPNKDGVRTFARLLAQISMKQGNAKVIWRKNFDWKEEEMSQLKLCQGPSVMSYKTKDRIRGQ